MANLLERLARVYLQREQDRVGITAQRRADADRQIALRGNQMNELVKQAQLRKLMQELELAPAEQRSQIDLRDAQTEAARSLSAQRDTAAARPDRVVERTVDLGDKVEYIYSDGRREVKPKGTLRQPPTVVINTRDEQGRPVTRIVPKTAGSEYEAPPTQAERNIASGSTVAQLTRKMAQQHAVPVIEDISKRITALNRGSEGGLGARATGSLRSLKGRIGLDAQADMYRTGVRGFTPLFARSVGHNGVLTEQDVLRTEELFPRIGDSESTTREKLARVVRIMTGREALPFVWEKPDPADSAVSGDPDAAQGAAAPPPSSGKGFRVIGVR